MVVYDYDKPPCILKRSSYFTYCWYTCIAILCTKILRPTFMHGRRRNKRTTVNKNSALRGYNARGSLQQSTLLPVGIVRGVVRGLSTIIVKYVRFEINIRRTSYRRNMSVDNLIFRNVFEFF